MPTPTSDRWNDGPTPTPAPGSFDAPIVEGDDIEVIDDIEVVADPIEPLVDLSDPATSNQPELSDHATSDQPEHSDVEQPAEAHDAAADAAVADVTATEAHVVVDEPMAPAEAVHANNAEDDEDGEVADDVVPGTAAGERDRTIERLQRQIVAMRAAHRDALEELRNEHADTAMSAEASFARQLSGERAGHAATRLELATATARIKRLSGTDQHRIGDLEAQVTTLEDEAGQLRSQLEAERIGHVRALADERGAADRALDQARRDFRDELDARDQQSRTTLADHRRDLDDELARDRASLEQLLESEHQAHESAISAERARHREELERLHARQRTEISALQTEHDNALVRQATQTKKTIAELRASEKSLSSELAESRKSEQQYRGELAASQTRERAAGNENREALASVRSELAVARKGLQAEKDRNAALRQDVVRRTAEAHNAIDQAIEERSTQLAELEELMTRQRELAEQRVREANSAADERARAAAKREAELSARVARLERELQQLRERSA